MQNQGLGQSMQFAMKCCDHLAFSANSLNMRFYADAHKRC